MPANITLLCLPPYAPELNPVENVWQYLRGNQLKIRLWHSYEAIVEACCSAWNALVANTRRLASLTRRAWARIKNHGRWYEAKPNPITALVTKPGCDPSVRR